jgi:hypothetical protein
MHRCRFGKTNRATHKALNPGPQIDVLALDFLRVLFTNGVLLWVDVPLVRPPSICVKGGTHPKNTMCKRWDTPDQILPMPLQPVKSRSITL